MLKKLLDGYDEAKDELSKEYLTFSERKRSYDKVRYLDETGMESVRVNFNEGNPGRVPEEKLQLKESVIILQPPLYLRGGKYMYHH